MNAIAEPSALRPLRPNELATVPDSQLAWLWHGYLAKGKVTALISPPKAGKTTLAAHLLWRLQHGGPFAGSAVVPARAVVVSEEAAADWDTRCRHLAIGPQVQFLCRPFLGVRPSFEQWMGLITGLQLLHREQPFDLLIFDALASFLPGHAEICAPQLLDSLLPLQSVAALGPAIWLLHHPAKGRLPDGQSARGTNALAGFVDILMEMSCVHRARSRDRRRRISAYSRYDETPRHRIIELDPANTQYHVRTDAAGTPLAQPWPELHYILARSIDKLSDVDILTHWPQDARRPSRSTLARWLKRATRQGLICRSGGGYRNDPFRYWLPGHEPLLWPGVHANADERQAWEQRWREHEDRLHEQANQSSSSSAHGAA